MSSNNDPFKGVGQGRNSPTFSLQVATSLSKIMPMFTAQGSDPDTVIETLLVLKSKRKEVTQEQIPDFFWQARGKWKIRGRLHSLSQVPKFSDKLIKFDVYRSSQRLL